MRPAGESTGEVKVTRIGKPVEDDLAQVSIQPRKFRPTVLAGFLIPEFTARNSSFLMSIAVHVLAFLVLSLISLHRSTGPVIFLELAGAPGTEVSAFASEDIFAELNPNVDNELVAAAGLNHRWLY